MILSFTLFLALFVLIGLSSVFQSRGTKKDYYLASSSIAPSLVGLSAVATNNSGYMFIGVIGYTYVTGLASIWLMIGWIAGDLLVSAVTHERLRKATARTLIPRKPCSMLSRSERFSPRLPMPKCSSWGTSCILGSRDQLRRS